MAQRAFDLWDVALACIVVGHVLLTPYTKVEESFNLQATHDFLFHGTDLSAYDHNDFPGVVPRTFVGSFLVSVLSYLPAKAALVAFDGDKQVVQIVVRTVLGLVLAASFCVFRNAAAAKFGPDVGRLLVVITATQFHLPFYMSRPLPNTFALCPVLLAYAMWLRGRMSAVIGLLAFAVAIFRAELLVLAGPIVLGELIRRRLALGRFILVGVISTAASIALTVAFDSVLWGRTLWPEGEVLYFNTVMNRSKDYGTAPFLWYFYSAIPRALNAWLPWLVAGVVLDTRITRLTIPLIAFVALYSFLPHKELRFIMYAFPVFNLGAAVGVARMLSSPRFQLLRLLALLGSIAIACFATATFVIVSTQNYPGGNALQQLHTTLLNGASVDHGVPSTFADGSVPRVFISNLAAQTGVSRFGQLKDSWLYVKEDGAETDYKRFTHFISETQLVPVPTRVLSTVKGFDKLGLDWSTWPPHIEFSLRPMLYILAREN